jgi:hypothetical protein
MIDFPPPAYVHAYNGPLMVIEGSQADTSERCARFGLGVVVACQVFLP